jgi:hypothetical protein
MLDKLLRELTEPVVASGRSHAGFNPDSKADVNLCSAVLDGNNVVRGFRNSQGGPAPRRVFGEPRISGVLRHR